MNIFRQYRLSNSDENPYLCCMNDVFYLNRCIELAQKAKGYTYPNPMVGAVIVHNGKIIGEGYHQRAGEPHAEINAIHSVKNHKLLPESTIYVSLEPCSHYGKTPPCALKLKEIGFKRVVIGIGDIHSKVNGQGIKILEDAGINVDTDILCKESWELNKRFFTFHQKKRPYIILKWAESLDGFIDKDFQPIQISNSLAKQITHRIRSEEHAILVGTQTALRDNPSLTTREIFGQNPIRLLIDWDLQVPKHYNLLNTEAETIIFNQHIDRRDGNLQYITIRKDNFLNNLMDKLYELQIQSMIIEGGTYTIQQFINENLWDEAIIFKNPNKNLNFGTKAPKFPMVAASILPLRDNNLHWYFNNKTPQNNK